LPEVADVEEDPLGNYAEGKLWTPLTPPFDGARDTEFNPRIGLFLAYRGPPSPTRRRISLLRLLGITDPKRDHKMGLEMPAFPPLQFGFPEPFFGATVTAVRRKLLGIMGLEHDKIERSAQSE